MESPCVLSRKYSSPPRSMVGMGIFFSMLPIASSGSPQGIAPIRGTFTHSIRIFLSFSPRMTAILCLGSYSISPCSYMKFRYRDTVPAPRPLAAHSSAFVGERPYSSFNLSMTSSKRSIDSCFLCCIDCLLSKWNKSSI